jgi:hypothetical protein
MIQGSVPATYPQPTMKERQPAGLSCGEKRTKVDCGAALQVEIEGSFIL